jgi:hypothetical protein
MCIRRWLEVGKGAMHIKNYKIFVIKCDLQQKAQKKMLFLFSYSNRERKKQKVYDTL